MIIIQLAEKRFVAYYDREEYSFAELKELSMGEGMTFFIPVTDLKIQEVQDGVHIRAETNIGEIEVTFYGPYKIHRKDDKDDDK